MDKHKAGKLSNHTSTPKSCIAKLKEGSMENNRPRWVSLIDSVPTYFSWMLLVVLGHTENHKCKSSEVKSFPPTIQYSCGKKKKISPCILKVLPLGFHFSDARFGRNQQFHCCCGWRKNHSLILRNPGFYLSRHLRGWDVHHYCKNWTHVQQSLSQTQIRSSPFLVQ